MLKKNKIDDKINKSDLLTDKDGYGFIKYELEISSVNDDYIKLGAIWKKDTLYGSKVIKNYNQETGELEITYEKKVRFNPGDFVSVDSLMNDDICGNANRLSKISFPICGQSYYKNNNDEIIRRYHSDYEHQKKLEDPLYPFSLLPSKEEKINY